MKNKSSYVSNYKTELSLIRAHVELLREIPYDKITVKDICERAGVNRTTFYNHFQNKDDVFAKNLHIWKKHSFIKNLNYPENATFSDKLKVYLTEFFKVLYSSKEDLKQYVENGNINYFVAIYTEFFFDDFVILKNEEIDKNDVAQNIISSFIVGGISNAGIWWIKNDFKTDVNTVVDILMNSFDFLF